MTEERCPTCHRTIKASRSNNQNRYYWGIVVDLLSEHTGFSPEEMHEILKHKFLAKPVWIHKKNGVEELSVITGTTTRLTTKQFEDFLSKVRTWASADLGVVIPEPHEDLARMED